MYTIFPEKKTKRCWTYDLCNPIFVPLVVGTYYVVLLFLIFPQIACLSKVWKCLPSTFTTTPRIHV